MTMRSPEPSRRTRRLISAAIIALLAALTAAYLPDQRGKADLLALSQAVQGISFGDSATARSAAGGRPMEGAMLYMHLFLDSDAASRWPIQEVGRAWIAYRAWDSIDIAVGEGDSPPVASVARGEEAAAAFPEVAALVRTVDGVRCFDNSAGKLAAVLKKTVDAERAAALRAIRERAPDAFGPGMGSVGPAASSAGP